MPDTDSLAFDIKFALRQQAIGARARKFIRSLSDRELGAAFKRMLKHLAHGQ